MLNIKNRILYFGYRGNLEKLEFISMNLFILKLFKILELQGIIKISTRRPKIKCKSKNQVILILFFSSFSKGIFFAKS